MLFIRLAFLLLCCLNLSMFAQIHLRQAEQPNKIKPYKFDEYQTLTDDELRRKLENFIKKVKENDQLRGYIYNFAPTHREISLREIQLRRNWNRNWCHWGICQVSWASGYSERERTEFWITASEKEMPEFKPKAYRIGEIDTISQSQCNEKVEEFKLKLMAEKDSTGLIAFYGYKDKEIKSRKIKECFKSVWKGLDQQRVKFIEAGRKMKRTAELWVVPKGAEPLIFMYYYY